MFRFCAPQCPFAGPSVGSRRTVTTTRERSRPLFWRGHPSGGCVRGEIGFFEIHGPGGETPGHRRLCVPANRPSRPQMQLSVAELGLSGQDGTTTRRIPSVLWLLRRPEHAGPFDQRPAQVASPQESRAEREGAWPTGRVAARASTRGSLARQVPFDAGDLFGETVVHPGTVIDLDHHADPAG